MIKIKKRFQSAINHSLAVWVFLLIGLQSAAAYDLVLTLSCIDTNAPVPAKSGVKPMTTNYFLPAGTPVLLKVSILNSSDRTQYLAASDLRLVPADFDIRRSDNTRPASMVRSHRIGRHGELIAIAPARAANSDVDLFTLYPPAAAFLANRSSLFEPGTYTVTMKRDFKESAALDGERLWVGAIESNPIKLTVEPPSKEQIENLWRRFYGADGKEKISLSALLAAVSPEDRRFLDLATAANSELRLISIRALANSHRKDKQRISTLEKILRVDEDSMVRSYAAEALGKLIGTNAVPALIEAVKSRQETSYRAAVQVLGQVGDERAIPVLTDVAAKDSEDWVKKAAADSVDKIRNRKLIPKN